MARAETALGLTVLLSNSSIGARHNSPKLVAVGAVGTAEADSLFFHPGSHVGRLMARSVIFFW